MTVEEILQVTQTLTFEERKKLIQGLFVQMPQTGGLAGTIVEVGDLDAGARELRQLVEQSLAKTAAELQGESEAPH